MDEAEFNRIAQQGYNRIPITIEALADLDTPLSIYLKLANQPYTYLLESVQGVNDSVATLTLDCPQLPALKYAIASLQLFQNSNRKHLLVMIHLILLQLIKQSSKQHPAQQLYLVFVVA